MQHENLKGWTRNVPLMAEGYHEDVLARADALRGDRTIYPPRGMEFNALRLTPFDAVRVVLLGQDPYHRPGQAHGLSFSVPEGVPAPPSLRNMFKEITASVYGGLEHPMSTDLTRWARQGVLLLNAMLTVEEGKPGSHGRLGWERLSDAIVQALSERREHLVFMLWGNFARSKASLVDASRHLVLEAAHPSPLSAYRGFFGCGHFVRANAYLREHGEPPIEW
ncbi:uracil-DNA glycosylase [Desulfobaculum xiamenense]|uniref:Uracil-DNA glycosylase n=1 Tax=Desulfobaculum xiamenense TaxID=995050 RepID=A0A846QDW0_9BACT|nr:uracil-DNA glycosylase [Desulfobaculum xiamenense]NJB66916.1 uracil-DNA glycosylase [Desulfobaculum xiamenense]